MGRRVAQLEKDLAAANGIMQANKEQFEEEKVKSMREVDEERAKSQSHRLKYEATIDQLQRELAKKNPTAAPGLMARVAPEQEEDHTPSFMLKLIMSELKEKRKENDNLSMKLEYDQKLRASENEYQEKVAALKTQMKHVFNLDLQNLKLTYEHQLKQLKISMKKQDEEMELLKHEMIKKDGEIGMLKEKNQHLQNERKMRLEHAEFLCKVSEKIGLI